MRRFAAFIEQFFTTIFRYSRSEQRGGMVLIVVAAAALVFVVSRPEKMNDGAWLAEVDRLADSLRADYYRRTYGDASARPTVSESRFRPAATARKPTVYIELNGADSARLTTVRGIGPVIARNIVAYRARLGGFVSMEQLREVWGVTDENFAALAAQFFIDTAVIQKINLNFATPNDFRSHPYFTASMAERVVRARETKGGWKALKDLTDNDILLPHEAKKIAAYVAF